MRELSNLSSEIRKWDELSQRLADARELAELDDPEINAEIAVELKELSKTINILEFRTLFSGQYDSDSAILAITAAQPLRQHFFRA